jgi:hypothetical protein
MMPGRCISLMSGRQALYRYVSRGKALHAAPGIEKASAAGREPGGGAGFGRQAVDQ